jgi:hypothetical protein
MGGDRLTRWLTHFTRAYHPGSTGASRIRGRNSTKTRATPSFLRQIPTHRTVDTALRMPSAAVGASAPDLKGHAHDIVAVSGQPTPWCPRCASTAAAVINASFSMAS